MQLLPVLPPETVRDYLVVVLTAAFIIRISMIIGPLRRLATSIDDDIEHRSTVSNLMNVSDIFLKPSIQSLGKSFILSEVFILFAPMLIALPVMTLVGAREILASELSPMSYPIFAGFLVLWLARDIRRSSRLRAFLDVTHIRLEGMWMFAEEEFRSWNLNQDFRRSWFLNELQQADLKEAVEGENGILSGFAGLLSRNPIAVAVVKQIKRGLDSNILAPFSEQIHSTVMSVIRMRMNQIVGEQLEDFRRKSPMRRANLLFEALLPTMFISALLMLHVGGI
ncbi:MAG: hypothetical protein CMB75_02975 [Euryarchaeota archaeon]|mgnify:CR=1 FL=1|nr:hypothetical protein [Euryarchaeota archaeon]